MCRGKTSPEHTQHRAFAFGPSLGMSRARCTSTGLASAFPASSICEWRMGVGREAIARTVTSAISKR